MKCESERTTHDNEQIFIHINKENLETSLGEKREC